MTEQTEWKGLTLEYRNDTNFSRTVGNSVYANAQVPCSPDLQPPGVLVYDDDFPLSTGPVIHF